MMLAIAIVSGCLSVLNLIGAMVGGEAGKIQLGVPTILIMSTWTMNFPLAVTVLSIYSVITVSYTIHAAINS